ncbi:MAG: hypothetical protein H6672_21595 [Anaerolineaceae bacterium]|nr:hypothetical protein [Anaerolineaceae bacterium]
MFPIFTPPSSDDDFDAKRRTKIMLALGLGVLALGGFVLMFLMESGALFTPVLFIIIGVIVLLAILAPMIALAQQNQRKQTAEATKAKRGLDGTDMYSLIDRMVDDLDEDEAAYLRRRLDDRERGLKRDATKDALADLLDERDDSAREGWR